MSGSVHVRTSMAAVLSSLLVPLAVGTGTPAAASPPAAAPPAASGAAAPSTVAPMPAVAPAPVPGVERANAPVPQLAWTSCGAADARLQCATATVPLDHDEPGGATTQVALAKWPATDRTRRVGTVFVNPGGPGGSGVGLVVDGFGAQLGGNLDGRFDVVGFDPRGVGASDPLRCFDSTADLERFFAGVPAFPYRIGQYRPFYDRYASLAQECLDDRDDRRIARHMSTADVARDLDLLRRAVGDDALSYLGFSYGSYLGNTYANLFPDRVRALVIDGVLDPGLWASGQHIRLDRTSTRSVFREFLRLCDAARSQCAFWTPTGSSPRWQALADRLRRTPVALPTDGETNDEPADYTYDLLVADANGAMYAPEVWGGPEGFAAFLDLVADAALGDAAAARRVAAVRELLLDRLDPAGDSGSGAGSAADEADYDNGFDAYYGNQCADTQYPRSFLSWLAVDVYAAAGSRWGPLWWWGNAGCARWPVAADRYTGPWTAHTSAPVLVVGNYFDNATDYAGAVASDRLLRNSRLLSYAGWGHTAYGRSACVTGHVDSYLLRGALPARGTVCPANPNPFLPSAARSPAAGQPLVGLPGAARARARAADQGDQVR